MPSKPNIAVIGLGRFGMSLAKNLGPTDAQVMAIDRDPMLVDEVKDFVEVALKLDSTDESVLRSQELGRFDICVVAIGEDFEAALLTCVIAKRLEVPRIVCRAQSDVHAEIFRQVGATEIIQPETQAGEHLARRLANPHLQDFMHLAEGLTVIEVHAPEQFFGHSIKELMLRNKYGINLIAIRRPLGKKADGDAVDEKIIGVPQADEIIQPNDVLVMLGDDQSLSRLPRD